MVALTRTALRLDASEAEIARWRREFDSAHTVMWPGFLAPDLASLVRSRLAGAPVTLRIEGTREIEHVIDDAALLGALHVVLCDPALWRLIQAVTGCRAISAFSGRIYRRERRPGGEHYFPWHNDVTDGRLVGLSINLSERPYIGGRLQIRDAATTDLLADVATEKFGDAMIFRIDELIEHQVTPVDGPDPRTVLAGWFREGADYWSLVRQP
jgi:hypothetical protein